MTRPVLRTERIRLQPLSIEHTDLLVELDADPEVMRFITGRGLTRAEVLRDHLPRRTRADADERGLGYWVGFDDTREHSFLGWWCLALDDTDRTAAELGYRLARTAWGRGYASEGALGLIAYGFDTVGLELVWAETMVANQRSQLVMATSGLSLARHWVQEWEEPIDGSELGELRYELTRTEWQTRRPR